MLGERTVSSWRITTKPMNKEEAGKQNAMKQKQAFPVTLALVSAESESHSWKGKIESLEAQMEQVS